MSDISYLAASIRSKIAELIEYRENVDTNNHKKTSENARIDEIEDLHKYPQISADVTPTVILNAALGRENGLEISLFNICPTLLVDSLTHNRSIVLSLKY